MPISILEKEFNKILKNEDIKIVSFDIFDTLLFRILDKPTLVFKKVGKKNFVKKLFFDEDNFYNYRIEAERLARKSSKYEEITFNEIYEKLPIEDIFKDRIKKIEIKEEKKILFKNKQIYKWIKLVSKHNKKVILTSDMYFSKSQIIELLDACHIDLSLINEIYVSSEYKARKSTKTLYRIVSNKENIGFENICHIGDNKLSDVDSAKSLGIKTIYYNLNDESKDILNIEKFFSKSFNNVDSIRKLSILQNFYENKKEHFFYNLGILVFAPSLKLYCNYLKDIYKKNNLNQINFLMREGKTFQKLLKITSPEINTNLIYASRASTTFALIDIENLEKNGIDFYHNRTFKLKDFYTHFKIDLNNPIIIKYQELSCYEASNIVVRNKSLLDLVSDNILSQIEQIKKNINYEKDLIKKYLDSLKIEENSLSVDFGGRGTVIKRLNEIYNNKFSKINSLFYTYETAYDKNFYKLFLPFFSPNNKNKDDLYMISRSFAVLEVLLNGESSSTKGYKKEKNKIAPIMDNNNFLDPKIAKAFFNGIESYFKIAKKYNFEHSIKQKEDFLQLILRLIKLPTENESKYLGNLFYDFGDNSSHKEKIVPDNFSEDLMEITKNHLKNKYHYIHKLHWVEGFITSKDVNLLANFYGISNALDIEDAINYLIKILKKENIKKGYIYGAGEFGQRLLPKLKAINFEIISFIDQKAANKNYVFEGYNVTQLKNIKEKEFNIVIASNSFIEQIKETVNKFSFENNLKAIIYDISK